MAAARADVIYTITGSGTIAGTNFTYRSTSGFLAFNTGFLTPTTSTDLFTAGNDRGPLKDFDFTSATSFRVDGTISGGFIGSGSPSYQISAVTPLETLPGSSGTLSITQTASTPEPSTFVLLGAGFLGIVGVRRRFSRS